jgi:hypothetical protein
LSALRARKKRKPNIVVSGDERAAAVDASPFEKWREKRGLRAF